MTGSKAREISVVNLQRIVDDRKRPTHLYSLNKCPSQQDCYAITRLSEFNSSHYKLGIDYLKPSKRIYSKISMENIM